MMKNDLTTGTWQDSNWCPIIIILLCTSDELKAVSCKNKAKKSTAVGQRSYLKVFWRTRAPPLPPRNPPPRNLPPRNLPTFKMQATTIPRVPNERGSKENAASHSMVRRPQKPQFCANRPACNEGDTQKLWVRPKHYHLHPSERTTCAGQNTYGSVFHPFHKQTIPWPNNKEIYPCSSSYCPRLWSKIYPRS